MTARDQSNPEKTGTAAVRVNVLRSNTPPVWVNNAPYNTAITNDVAAGTTIFTQSRAVDSDLTVRATYLTLILLSICILYLTLSFMDIHVCRSNYL